jgi:hypothetical protein
MLYHIAATVSRVHHSMRIPSSWHFLHVKFSTLPKQQFQPLAQMCVSDHVGHVPCGYCCPCGVYGAICWPPGGTIPGWAAILYGCIWDGGASGCWYPLWVAIGEWLIRVGPLPSDWPLEGRGGIGMFCWPANAQYYDKHKTWNKYEYFSFLALSLFHSKNTG